MNQVSSNWDKSSLTDTLARIPGVALVNYFSLSKYAKRIWLDPARLTNLRLTAMDAENAIQEQNQKVAAGKIGQIFQYQLNTLAVKIN